MWSKVKALDCGILVSEFELQLLRSLSDKYSRERYEAPYPSSYRLNSAITVKKDCFGINNLRRLEVPVVMVVGNGHGDTSSNPGRG